MRLAEFYRSSGIPKKRHKCQYNYCRKQAVIEWDCCKMLFCQNHARELALGLLRDVVAGEVGEQLAQDKYCEIRAIYG